MSAKYMYRLSDENPDLEKQIGCMNGIFQLFDRHHILGGSRRTARQNQKRLPSGQNGNHGNGVQPKGAPQKKTTEKKARALKEKHRTSTESSRTSFSSSSCSSSISSLECSRAPQMEPSSFSQSAAAPENHARNLHTYKPNSSLQSKSQQSLDLRDVVKDSIYREARGLSVKTATTGEARGQTLKFIDSPRPSHYLNSVSPKDPGPRESFRVLHKLRESPSKSSEGKSSFLAGGLKDARRFSYDGRESSRDTLKSTIKLKELPRLSLDSRAGSVRGSNPEMKSNFLSSDLGRDDVNSNSLLNNQQEPESNKRPSSVVAKLMGLEALPDPVSTGGNRAAQMKTQLDEDNKFLGSSRTADLDKQNRVSGSPRYLHKEPTSPSQRNAATAKKLTATSRFPMEPAPWRQPDGSSRGSQAPAQKNQATLAKVPSSSLSVYGEIEKRLAQLQFQKSGKDLRALKQILEAMQKTKEIFETRKEDSRFENRTSIISSLGQSSKLANLQDLQSNSPISVPTKGSTSPKSFKSSIVIMKPAKFIGKAINPVSAINSTDSSSGIHRLRVATPENGRKESVDKQAAKDVSPRIKNPTDHSNKPLNRYPVDKNAGARIIRLAQPSKEIRSPTREATNSGKRSEIMNVRQQQKKLGFEKQSCPATASSESNRRRRQPGKQPTDSCSPHQKPRAKSLNLQPSDYESSDISDLRDSSHQSDAVSESNISLASQYDDEVLSIDRSNKINKTSIQQAHLRQRNLVERSTKDTSIPEPRPASSEQPSPVSVLDAAFFGDELPSPIKKISIAFKDDEALKSDGVEWIPPIDENYSFHSMNSSLYSMFNQKNGKNPKPLIQNLKEMLSTHEEYITDETTPFYNHANPDHQYISQIYLASGLQKDFESGLGTINLHPTGTPINPDIFHGLEQAKASSGHFNDDHCGKKISLSETHAKIQRKLLFDVVNEILVHKLLSENSSKQWLSSKMLAGKGQKGQKLLGDLCSEIDRLQCLQYLLDEEDDNSRSVQWEDLMHESIHWTACHDEIQGIVLAVERLIFKDLITEVINSEMIGRQGRLAGHRRQLFPK